MSGGRGISDIFQHKIENVHILITIEPVISTENALFWIFSPTLNICCRENHFKRADTAVNFVPGETLT